MSMKTHRARTKLQVLSGFLAVLVTGCQSDGYQPFLATQAAIGSLVGSHCGLTIINFEVKDVQDQPEADQVDTTRDSTQTAPRSNTSR